MKGYTTSPELSDALALIIAQEFSPEGQDIADLRVFAKDGTWLDNDKGAGLRRSKNSENTYITTGQLGGTRIQVGDYEAEVSVSVIYRGTQGRETRKKRQSEYH